MQTKVWAVTSGRYSDYSVELLFTTKELAEAFIASWSTRGESKWNEPNEKPECFTVWDELPGPDELRWGAEVVVADSQVMGRNEWSFQAVPWQEAFNDSEIVGEPDALGRVRFDVIRSTKEEAVQRVSEWVSEQIAVERTRLGM